MHKQIASLLGLEPDDLQITRLKGGYLNETLLFTAHREEYVVWCNRQQSADKVLRQQEAMRLLASTGLPVPDVKSAGLQAETGFYLLMNRLPGANLEAALENLTQQERESFFFQAGHMLGRIHASHSSDGAGFLENPPAERVSWRDWLQGRLTVWGNVIGRFFPEWDSLSALLRKEIDRLPESNGHYLLHGDYYLGNLLYQRDQITGLLDFEWSLWGDRLYDFRVMDLFLFPVFGCEEAFAKGYCEVLPLPDEHRAVRELYKAIYRSELLWMAYELFGGDEELAAEQTAALREWLNSKTLDSRKHKAVLISIGTEMTEGQYPDTNSAWLAKRLLEMGISTVQIEVVPDHLDQIREAFASAGKRADLVLSTGGLGGTHDDLTREALGREFGLTWACDPDARKRLQELYAEWGVREIPDQAFDQALYPLQGARIPNPLGSALGFYFQQEGSLYVSLPGVPHEMTDMFTRTVRPLIRETFRQSNRRTLCDWMYYGTTEENVSKFMQPLEREGLQAVVLVDRGMIRVQVTVSEEEYEHKGGELEAAVMQVKTAIADWQYGEKGETVEQAYVRHNAGRPVLILDHATGGMCSALLKLACPDFPVRSAVGSFEPLLSEAELLQNPPENSLVLVIDPLRKTERSWQAEAEFVTAEGSNRRTFQVPLHYANYTERLARLILFEELKIQRTQKSGVC